MVMRDVIGVFSGIVVLAGIAVALSKQSDTANVISAFGSSFGSVIKAATLQG